MVIAARNWLEEDLAWTPLVSGLYLLRTVSLGELPVSRSASGFRVNAHTTLPSGLSATAHLGLALPGCSSRLSLSACHSFLFFLIILFFWFRSPLLPLCKNPSLLIHPLFLFVTEKPTAENILPKLVGTYPSSTRLVSGNQTVTRYGIKHPRHRPPKNIGRRSGFPGASARAVLGGGGLGSHTLGGLLSTYYYLGKLTNYLIHLKKTTN